MRITIPKNIRIRRKRNVFVCPDCYKAVEIEIGKYSILIDKINYRGDINVRVKANDYGTISAYCQCQAKRLPKYHDGVFMICTTESTANIVHRASLLGHKAKSFGSSYINYEVIENKVTNIQNTGPYIDFHRPDDLSVALRFMETAYRIKKSNKKYEQHICVKVLHYMRLHGTYITSTDYLEVSQEDWNGLRGYTIHMKNLDYITDKEMDEIFFSFMSEVLNSLPK